MLTISINISSSVRPTGRSSITAIFACATALNTPRLTSLFRSDSTLNINASLSTRTKSTRRTPSTLCNTFWLSDFPLPPTILITNLLTVPSEAVKSETEPEAANFPLLITATVLHTALTSCRICVLSMFVTQCAEQLSDFNNLFWVQSYGRLV